MAMVTSMGLYVHVINYLSLFFTFELVIFGKYVWLELRLGGGWRAERILVGIGSNECCALRQRRQIFLQLRHPHPRDSGTQ